MWAHRRRLKANGVARRDQLQGSEQRLNILFIIKLFTIAFSCGMQAALTIKGPETV